MSEYTTKARETESSGTVYDVHRPDGTRLSGGWSQRIAGTIAAQLNAKHEALASGITIERAQILGERAGEAFLREWDMQQQPNSVGHEDDDHPGTAADIRRAAFQARQ